MSRSPGCPTRTRSRCRGGGLVYRTPGGVVAPGQLGRLLGRLARLTSRHPLVRRVLTLMAVVWLERAGPPSSPWSSASSRCWPPGGGPVRCRSRRWIARPARGERRGWHYRRRWAAVMTVGGLAPFYQGRIMLPVLGKVTSTRYTDRVEVRLVSGQSAADFANHAENLAHGFGAMLCRVRTARPGRWCWSSSAVTPWPPRPRRAGPAASGSPGVAGRAREDGLPWLVRLRGTHMLIAGATGAGKASLLWALVRALLPLMQAGLVRVLAADPKLIELAYGQAIFDTYGNYAADRAAIAAMLEAAVADMQGRAARFAGKRRDQAGRKEPFVRCWSMRSRS